MNRMMIAGIAGTAIGGGAVALARWIPGRDSADAMVIDPTPLMAVSASQPVDLDRLLVDSQGTDAQARMLEAIAEVDFAGLPTLVWDLASRPESPARNYALSSAARRLAERDAGQALAALGQSFLDPRTAREVALVVLEQLEPEAASVNVVLEALPQIDAYQMQVDAVALFANSSVEAALAYALTLEHRGQRRRALRAAAPQLLARSAEAYTFIDTIRDGEVRADFESTLLSELASEDMGAVSALFAERYPASDPERQEVGMRLVRNLSSQAPATAVALIGELDLDWRGGWTRAAWAWLARTNPEAGRAFAERPSAEPFDRVRSTVATVLAEQDPDATISWLRSLDPMPGDLARGVVSGVARVDPLRAIELGEELAVAGSLDRVDTLAQSASFLAERVLAIQDPVRRDEWLESLMQGWGWVDKVAAMDWAFANADRLSPQVFERIGRTRGNEDPAAALLATPRLPEPAQEAWVSSVIRGAMGADPVAALDWVGQFRGQPFYDMAAASIVASGVWSDVEPVRDVFDTLSDARKAAVARGLVMNWHRSDADAAHAWVTGLAVGDVRDEAVSGLIEAGMYARLSNRENVSPFDGFEQANEPLMNLYSSKTVRGEAVISMLENIARRDAMAAQRLIEAYVEDPYLRERAELLLEAVQR